MASVKRDHAYDTARIRSGDNRSAGNKPVGLYSDTDGDSSGLLTSAPNRPLPPQDGQPVFPNEESFEAVRSAAIPVKPLSQVRQKPSLINSWSPPEKAAPYLEHIRLAEELHELPKNLVAAMAHTESSFNPRAVSNKGARGLMQIVPKSHPGVNVDNPATSIDYGAEYVSKLKKRFGSWELALAAYNWGPGNLLKYGIGRAPKETREYVKSIMSKIHVEPINGS